MKPIRAVAIIRGTAAIMRLSSGVNRSTMSPIIGATLSFSDPADAYGMSVAPAIPSARTALVRYLCQVLICFSVTSSFAMILLLSSGI